jgi:hypothetical protein
MMILIRNNFEIGVDFCDVFVDKTDCYYHLFFVVVYWTRSTVIGVVFGF